MPDVSVLVQLQGLSPGKFLAANWPVYSNLKVKFSSRLSYIITLIFITRNLQETCFIEREVQRIHLKYLLPQLTR